MFAEIGDTNPWRDIGHAKWYDPLAAYEDSRSKEFKEAIKDLTTPLLRGSTQQRTSKTKTTQKIDFKTLLQSAKPTSPEHAHETILWNDLTVKIQHTFGGHLHVWIGSSTSYMEVTDFGVDPESDLYFVINDVGKGAETLQLGVYRLVDKKPIYTIQPVGPHAVFHGAHLLYQNVENQLRYPAIFRTDANTGHGKQKVFEEKDKRFQVELIAPPRQSDVFVKTANALSQRLGILEGTRVRWITPKPPNDGAGTTLIPIDADTYLTNTTLVHKHKHYALPKDTFAEDGMRISPNAFVITTVRNAATSCYVFDTTTRSFYPLLESQTPNEIMLHHASTRPSLTMTSPCASNKMYEIVDSFRLALIYTAPQPLHFVQCTNGFAGRGVPYTFVSAVHAPKKLIVEAYGAYGISGHRSYPIRWLPWLAHGFGYAVAFPRGGRENGDDWYDAARTALRKENTFYDTAAVIRAVQQRFRISTAQTIVYGRSAGGWTAAVIGQHFPHLVGAVYAEVPYLDVLRTTTNPRLPLTQLEYDEFGHPAARPAEYAALQRWSPVDSVPLAPAHAPFIYVKSALHDSQVLPYEALKWAKKSRGAGWNVEVSMDNEGGHFAAQKDLYTQLSHDATVLLAHMPHAKAYTRKAARHLSKGTHLRRTRSKKHSTRI